jgi:hypothetical protein
MSDSSSVTRTGLGRRETAGAARAIAWGGLAAGALDITAACVFYALRGVAPVRILQSVASGLLGAAAFQGGAATAALGLGLHFTIAFGAAGVYALGRRLLPVLSERLVLSGLAYGVVVYLVMNFVVLPLSAVAVRPFDPKVAVPMVVIHMLFVGLPIALAWRGRDTAAG